MAVMFARVCGGWIQCGGVRGWEGGEGGGRTLQKGVAGFGGNEPRGRGGGGRGGEVREGLMPSGPVSCGFVEGG